MPFRVGKRRSPVEGTQAPPHASSGRGPAEGPIERLGELNVPSGDLLILDFGLLSIWSNDDAPVLRATDAPPETVRSANEAVDLELVGPDAEALARRVDRANGRGPYYFDVRADHVPELRSRLEDEAREQDLDAAVIQLRSRMPHNERARRLLTAMPDGSEVPFHGLWAIACRGLPADRALPVFGQRMDPGGPDADRWWSVWVECGSGTIANSMAIGAVLVDEARLMFGDLHAIASVRTEVRSDDLVDLVFWGRDAVDLAERVGAGPVQDGTGQPIFGWVDLGQDDARGRFLAIEEARVSDDLKFATDLRPHTDTWALLKEARASPTGSGTLRIGDVAVCGFFTSWGDGAFPVYREVASNGGLLRIRVEVGAPEIVDRSRKMEERWFGDFAKLAMVSARVARDGEPVRWLYREGAGRDDDSGWRIFAGNESDEYLEDPSNAVVAPLRELLEKEPFLEPLLRTAAPCAFERQSDGSFQPVRDDRTPMPG